jgi:hypothetical protein
VQLFVVEGERATSYQSMLSKSVAVKSDIAFVLLHLLIRLADTLVDENVAMKAKIIKKRFWNIFFYFKTNFGIF